MSLTGFVNLPDVRAKIKSLRPAPPRTLPAAIQVKPHSTRYKLIGTAFDYLLRFELQRRAPHAVTKPWVAEYAPDLIWKETRTSGGGIWLDCLGPCTDDPMHDMLRLKELADKAREIVDKAKAAVAAYVKLRRPNRAKRADLASHAIRLAKLDSVYRAWKLDSRFQDADPEDVQELLSLLAIVPFDSLVHDKILFLNPHFQQVSEEVGGADVDLIAGDVLVDFKTTKESIIKVNYLDQLLGYYLLARRLRRMAPTFPEINRLALYFSRHGHLWVAEATRWTNNPRFSEVEEWFFQRAKDVYRRAENSFQTAAPNW